MTWSMLALETFHSYQTTIEVSNIPDFQSAFQIHFRLINGYGICYHMSTMMPVCDKLSIENWIIIIIYQV